MAAMSKIWKMTGKRMGGRGGNARFVLSGEEQTGPDFYFEMINDSTPLQKGDFVITVIFHLKDRPKLVEVEMTPGQKRLDMPELCSSFLVAVAEEDELDLITFDEVRWAWDVYCALTGVDFHRFQRPNRRRPLPRRIPTTRTNLLLPRNLPSFLRAIKLPPCRLPQALRSAPGQ